MNATAPGISFRDTDEILREHEIIYQTLFEASTDAIFMETLDGRVLDCNSAACKMFGYTREEFLQLTVADLTPPEVAGKLPEIITQELNTGGFFIKTSNRKKSGQIFPVEVNTQLVTIRKEPRVIVYVRDMTERRRAEKVQEALYRISESAHTAENLGELYALIHSIISGLMPARNFYIALYDAEGDLLSFPYWADEVDEAPPPQKPGRGLTEYILRNGQPLLATPEIYHRLLADGQIEAIGADSMDWLGAPLVIRQKIIGMMAVQTYTPDTRLSQADQDVLTFVSTQVAMTIERKQAEKARRESEDRYRTLFETAPVSVFLATPQGEIFEVNPVALEMLGSPSAQATKAINLLTFPRLIQAGFSADFQRCIDTRRLVVSECPYTSKWGKSIYMHYYLTPLLDAEGQVTLVQTIVDDITERKLAEQALRESEARMRSILETTPDFIYLIDPSAKIQYINHILEELSPGSVVGASALDFVMPEFRKSAQAEIDHVFQSGQIVNYTSQYRMSVNQRRWYESNIGPIYDGEGHIVAATLVSRDVTERKVAEEKIQRLNQDLERQAEQLTLLYEAGLALNRILEPHEQMKSLAQISIQALHADNSGFFRYDAGRDEISFEFGVGRGEGLEAMRDFRVQLGEERGLVGWIAQQRKPFYLPDVSTDPRWIVTDREIHSALWVPVEHENHLLGVLSLASTRPDAFTPADQQLLSLFANQVAVSLVNGQLYQAALDAAERRTALHWVSQEIIAARLEPERIYTAIHQAVLKLMTADAFIISILDDQSNEIELVYSVDRGRRYPGQRIPRQRGLSGHVITTGKSLIIHDLEGEGNQYDLVHFGEPPFVRSVLAVPMRLGDKIFGLVSAQSYRPKVYTTEDSNLLEILAAYAAFALDNSLLFTQMQASNRELGIAYEEMLESWSRALEMRDKETKGHSERVTRLSVLLARAMGMSEEEIMHFRRGVLLHDIGKMAIPDSILLKPSTLTEEEWIYMRQHPSYAYQMLGGIPFIRKSLDVPYCHHEKWDGSGYPRGLKGEKIPLGARVFAVVDVWDALIYDRPYRPGWLPDVARAYIEAHSGIYFDPRVVEEFLKILDTGELT